jgi:hypothetical protein
MSELNPKLADEIGRQSTDPWLDRLILNRMERVPVDASLMQVIAFHEGPGDNGVRKLRFSPLINPMDGSHYGDANFLPYWDALYDHAGWFELITSFGANPFMYALFFKDDEAVDPAIRKMCREFAQ